MSTPDDAASLRELMNSIAEDSELDFDGMSTAELWWTCSACRAANDVDTASCRACNAAQARTGAGAGAGAAAGRSVYDDDDDGEVRPSGRAHALQLATADVGEMEARTRNSILQELVVQRVLIGKQLDAESDADTSTLWAQLSRLHDAWHDATNGSMSMAKYGDAVGWNIPGLDAEDIEMLKQLDTFKDVIDTIDDSDSGSGSDSGSDSEGDDVSENPSAPSLAPVPLPLALAVSPMSVHISAPLVPVPTPTPAPASVPAMVAATATTAPPAPVFARGPRGAAAKVAATAPPAPAAARGPRGPRGISATATTAPAASAGGAAAEQLTLATVPVLGNHSHKAVKLLKRDWKGVTVQVIGSSSTMAPRLRVTSIVISGNDAHAVHGAADEVLRAVVAPLMQNIVLELPVRPTPINTDKVFVFVDNSNFYASPRNLARKAGTDTGMFFIKYDKVVAWIANGRRHVRGQVAGVMLDFTKKLWMQNGYTVAATNRTQCTPDLTDADAHVDEFLHAQILTEVMAPSHAAQRGTIVLVTGDGNDNGGRSSFPKCCAAALQQGWDVEVCAWEDSLSTVFVQMAALSDGRMRVRLLDDVPDLVVTAATASATATATLTPQTSPGSASYASTAGSVAKTPAGPSFSRPSHTPMHSPSSSVTGIGASPAGPAPTPVGRFSTAGSRAQRPAPGSAPAVKDPRRTPTPPPAHATMASHPPGLVSSPGVLASGVAVDMYARPGQLSSGQRPAASSVSDEADDASAGSASSLSADGGSGSTAPSSALNSAMVSAAAFTPAGVATGAPRPFQAQPQSRQPPSSFPVMTSPMRVLPSTPVHSLHTSPYSLAYTSPSPMAPPHPLTGLIRREGVIYSPLDHLTLNQLVYQIAAVLPADGSQMPAQAFNDIFLRIHGFQSPFVGIDVVGAFNGLQQFGIQTDWITDPFAGTRYPYFRLGM